jgi:SAM-dependent methyltransferase
VYYAGKIESLKDVFGARDVRVAPGRLCVDGREYPVVDDVVVLLPPSQWPAAVRERLGAGGGARGAEPAAPIAGDIQFTFGAEWQRFPRILPEHEKEFSQYFDLVDLAGLAGRRVCDLGCGIGRWSFFLKDACRELVLVDFSEAIFVARRNLSSAGNALFFLGDLERLPFRADFADLVVCLGVLHHLPTGALDQVRALGRLSPTLLVFLYYALDNRPRYWRALLAAVTAVRLPLSRVCSAPARSALTWALALGVYVPLVALGRAARPFGLERFVPLHEFYRDKSLQRIRQDVYDRFFTRIEQRFERDRILSLRDAFGEVAVSERPPYWHFVCRREPQPAAGGAGRAG